MLLEVNNSFMAKTGHQNEKLRMCEKVWNDAMSFRKTELTSEINKY